MSDDDLIRDAVHELVGAAPAPKPLPARGAPAGGSYRWLAVAAAAILVVGGIVAIAWLRSGDDDAVSVGSTTPPPGSTAPNTSPGTSVATSTIPGMSPPSTDPSATTSTTSPSTSTTTTPSTTTTTTTAPASPEAAVLQDYLTALGDGRYADAAVLLNEGGLEPERRADLRPLYTEYGDIADLPARLRSWCDQQAICTAPDSAPVDIGGFWVATWTTPEGVLTGYFRSSSFEGSASVHGLPPRRSNGSVRACPTSGVVLVREAELDADGHPESIVMSRGAGSELLVDVCNTSLSAPTLELPPTETPVAGVLDPSSAPDATLLFGEATETGVCAATYRMAASAGALVAVGWDGCVGNTGESIGCRYVEAESEIATYRYIYVDGDRLDNSTAMDVEVFSIDGAPVDSYTLTLPDQAQDALMIVDPHCNGLPVFTEG